MQDEFKKRLDQAVAELAAHSLNATLYWENKDFRKWVSIVPTSAHTGEGIPDILMLIMQLSQTMMADQMTLKNELKCTVMEVKMMEGFGHTLDVILVDGELHEGDTIVVCGLNGPIVTTIRGLRTPAPMKELRVKSEYQRHASVRAAMGLKIVAPGLEDAIAGSQLLVHRKRDDIEDLKDEVMGDLATILSRVSFLEDSKIPVCGISIGPVQKKDVIKASVMLEHRPEFATILAFDVKITKDAETMAESMGVKIFPARIIYHLFDMFTKYMDDVKKNAKKGAADEAVFPVTLEILPNFVFNTKDPIIIGVRVKRGVLKMGTPLSCHSKTDTIISVGIVESIEMNNEQVQEANVGDEVCVKIAKLMNNPVTVMYGRHFDDSSELFSKVTRKSIDLLKEHFKDEMQDDWWRLIIHLKRVFEII
jgi:translation initiation factor 5B